MGVENASLFIIQGGVFILFFGFSLSLLFVLLDDDVSDVTEYVLTRHLAVIWMLYSVHMRDTLPRSVWGRRGEHSSAAYLRGATPHTRRLRGGRTRGGFPTIHHPPSIHLISLGQHQGLPWSAPREEGGGGGFETHTSQRRTRSP